MKKPLLIAGMALAMALVTPSSAFAAATPEGPYGPVTFQDYGTCNNVWANVTAASTYKVSPVNNDGSYNVKLRIAGKFVTVAGQGPGACYPSANGDLVNAGAKGRVAIGIFLAVSGGTFDPNGTCDSTCAFDGYATSYAPISNFVAAFFGPDATWSFSPVKDSTEKATSFNSALCANTWTATFTLNPNAITSSSGDIATYCPA